MIWSYPIPEELFETDINISYEISTKDTTKYTNALGDLHRTDGPALVYHKQSRTWLEPDDGHYIFGMLHEARTRHMFGLKLNKKLHKKLVGLPPREQIYNVWNRVISGELVRQDAGALIRFIARLPVLFKYYGCEEDVRKIVDSRVGISINNELVISDRGECYVGFQGYKTKKYDIDNEKGVKYRTIDGLLHRDDGPAVIAHSRGRVHYLFGIYIEADKFAELTADANDLQLAARAWNSVDNDRWYNRGSKEGVARYLIKRGYSTIAKNLMACDQF